jgi:hypothetical protein
LLPIALFLGFVAIVLAAGAGFLYVANRHWIVVALGGALTAVVYARARRARPSVWSTSANAAAALAYAWVFLWLDTRWWWKALLMVAFTPLFVIANATVRGDLVRTARRRSARATAAARRMLAGGHVPRFALYLRPFDTTDHLAAQTARPEIGGQDDRASHVDVETILSRTLSKECEFIALGRPGDIVEGAARVVTGEDEWRDVIRRLLDEAAFIVVVPFPNEGTSWELSEIRSRGHLGKTVFVMPEMMRTQPNGVVAPRESDRVWDAGIRVYDPSKHFLDVSAEWRRARAIFGAAGFRLPPYCESGALFTLSGSGDRVTGIAPAPLSVLTRRQRYLREVLTRLGVMPWRRITSTDATEALEVAAFPSIRTREYVLLQGFDLAVTTHDATSTAAVIRRLNAVVRGHPRLVNDILASLPDQLDQLADVEARAVETENLVDWLVGVEAVTGVDETLLAQARAAVERLARRTGPPPPVTTE